MQGVAVAGLELARDFAVLDALVQAAPVGLGLADSSLRYVLVNGAMAAINGYAASEMIGRTPRELHGPAGGIAERLVKDVMATGLPALDAPVRPIFTCFPVTDPNGGMVGVGVVAVALPDAGSAPSGDFTRELEQELGRANAGLAIANTALDRLTLEAAADPLTGLANHRSFRQRLQLEVDRAQRHGRAITLALVDIDGFKDVNDAFGHPAGDDILQAVGAHLLAAVRTTDLVARVGGDEFAIVMPETSAAAAEAVAARACDLVRRDPSVRGVTVSIGICDLQHAADRDELLRFADGALYLAKAKGRDAVSRYHPDAVEDLSDAQRAERLARSHALVGLRALARAVDAKDRSTRLHSERVSSLAARLAEALDWPPERVAALRQTALLHDVGKIGVRDLILLKPSSLTPDEYEIVKTHASLGAQIVSEVLSAEQTSWLRSHHERHDGAGYPDGLAGDEIPDGARLLAVADSWDVMTSERPYTRAMRPSEAVAECRRCSGAQFAPAVIRTLTAPGFERTLRIFANEQAARHHNEVRLSHAREPVFSLHCECGAENCPASIDVPAAEYRAIRSHERRYIVCKGHELPNHEEVLATTSRYSVVEKA